MTDDKKTRENKVRQDPLTVLRNTFRILEKIRRYTPEFFLFTILEGVLWGAINSSVSVFTVRLFNSLDKGTDFPNAARIIGMMAIFAARAHETKDIVLTGNLSAYPTCRDTFANLSRMFSVNFVIPENSRFATVIGAALCEGDLA